MKANGIFIDLKNKEQVEWWNNVGRMLVKVARYDTIVETATNKPVGVLFMVKGLLSGYVIKKNNSFMKNLVTTVIDTKD